MRNRKGGNIRLNHDNSRDKNVDGSTSLNLAVGMTASKEMLRDVQKNQKEAMENRSVEERNRILKYHRNNGTDASRHWNEKRRKEMRRDDRNREETLAHLTDHQKRALLKRKRMGDRIVKTRLARHESKRWDAAMAASDAELVLHTEEKGFIETEHEMERTYKLTQHQIRNDATVDENTRRNIYDLNLAECPPYGMTFDRSGRHGLLHGRNGGHISLLDLHVPSTLTEFHLQERVHDATFLHNHTLFALAQARNVYIYDQDGIEIHRLDDHKDALAMQYLPYHWLLATVGRGGCLRYHDTSTGQHVSAHPTKGGNCNILRANPSNAILHCGHTNGTVTLWSPASRSYLIKMLCHKGAPVTSLALHPNGTTMVTGGADRQIKIWDLRTYKSTHAYFCNGHSVPSAMDISQKGVLGIGHGSNTTFWHPQSLLHKQNDPYMTHNSHGMGPVETLAFRPFEDVCGIGHMKGYSSIVIPGSGEPNLDSMEYGLNPYQDQKQHREAEVRALMDKLSPNMIAIDQEVIGTIDRANSDRSRLNSIREISKDANHIQMKDDTQGDYDTEDDDDNKNNSKKDNIHGNLKKEKKRMRGKNKLYKKLARKQQNVIDESMLKLKEARQEQQRLSAAKTSNLFASTQGTDKDAKEKAPTALRRFF
mmetsp:Transcript_13097/g.18754  ORF Transcript_13097/g.18754 Transcript_13097/m.18754 type:complete len:651 (+) Transcript_13097:59-2011(+)